MLVKSTNLQSIPEKQINTPIKQKEENQQLEERKRAYLSSTFNCSLYFHIFIELITSSHIQCLKPTLFRVRLLKQAMVLLNTLQQLRKVKICFFPNKTTLIAFRSLKAKNLHLIQIKWNNFIFSLFQARCCLQCQHHHLLQWLLDLPKHNQEDWYFLTQQGIFCRQRRNIKLR